VIYLVATIALSEVAISYNGPRSEHKTSPPTPFPQIHILNGRSGIRDRVGFALATNTLQEKGMGINKEKGIVII
jgi:hypothetical protein